MLYIKREIIHMCIIRTITTKKDCWFGFSDFVLYIKYTNNI